MKNNIVLIGMPTSGKSTVGVILAKLLGMDFVDSDLVIQKKIGKKLAEIISDEGLEGFLKIEEDVCCDIEAENTVIATGGSVVYGAAAMEYFKSIGRVVYLKIDYETLEARLHHAKQRGVVLRPGQSKKDLYDERTVLYEKYADIVISEEGKDIEGTVAGLREALL